MNSDITNSVLLLEEHSTEDASFDCVSQPFLFFLAQHFSGEGKRVLYISPKRFNDLPKVVNSDSHNTNPDILKLITFTYPESTKHLETLLIDGLRQQHAYSVVIVEQLDHFFGEYRTKYGKEHNGDKTKCGGCKSLGLCSKLIDFIEFGRHKQENPGILLASHQLPLQASVPRFFSNLWSCVKDKGQTKLTCLNPKARKKVEFIFSEDTKLRKLLLENVLTMDG